MATTDAPPGSETEVISAEEQALEGLEQQGLRGLERGVGIQPPDEPEAYPVKRLAVAVAFPTLAAAVMVGGIFLGVSPRFWAGIAGILGIAAAVALRGVKRPVTMNLLILGALFMIGIIVAVSDGLSIAFDIGPLVKRAATSGDVLRPPVILTSGWKAIVGWLMGGLGFCAAWVAIEIRRPALALLVPLPIVAIPAISVSEAAQVPSGIASIVLFAIGLGVLSGTEMGPEEQRPSLAFEVRRGLRALPMIAATTVALYFLSQTNFLFPKPLYDPTQEAQRPRTVPLAEVEDRVLFRVESSITGPWKMGNLDVYDESDFTWRLPPFAQSELSEVPRSGVVDPELQPGVRADFEVVDLGGAILPGLPNTVGIVAEGPKLAYDARTGNIRLAQGTIESGLSYKVVAAQIPKIEELRLITQPIPDDVQKYLDAPPPPPAVVDLLRQAPQDSAWDKMDFLRQTLLRTVVATGHGVPVPVPPSKVQDMLVGIKEGTPFEIVAAQALLARWAGVPARIGYGFDAGEEQPEGFLEVRPRHGASFLEVYFPTYKWLPVIGTPLQAKSSFSDAPQQFNPNVLASNEVAVQIYVPVALDPKGLLYAQIRQVLVVVLPIVLLFLGIYYTYPGVRKAISRSRRRSWAASEGAVARIAVAYADWRDAMTDFGYRFDSDTPLMFLDRVVEDAEHTELAWLVTRNLWGDMQNQVSDKDADAAEELSGALRKRLAQAHPATMRTIAALSRLSLRYPYAPDLGVLARGKEKAGAREAA